MSIKDAIKKSVLQEFTDPAVTMGDIAAALGMAAVLALYIYLIYKLVTRSAFYSRDFNKSLAMLPVITAGILLAMQSSFVISLGSVGALSIVRFRNAVKDPMDLVFLFWSISIGIVCGAKLYALAVLLSLVLTVLVFVLGLCLAQEVMEEESLWMGLRQAASVVVPVACVVLAFLWAVMTNRGYTNMQYQYEETYADLVRLADRIEQCEGYTPDMKLWLSDNEWPVTEDRTLGDLTGLSGMGGMKLFDWLHYRNDFMYLFGLKFEQCSQEEYRAIRETQEFQEMPNWPSTGSVKVINGVMVVKTDHEHVD